MFFFILYGNFSHGLPFGTEDEPSQANNFNGRHYRHQEGIRGMLFVGEDEQFQRIDNVIWNIDVDGSIEIGPLLHSGDVRWCDERLVTAYSAARIN